MPRSDIAVRQRRSVTLRSSKTGTTAAKSTDTRNRAFGVFVYVSPSFPASGQPIPESVNEYLTYVWFSGAVPDFSCWICKRCAVHASAGSTSPLSQNAAGSGVMILPGIADHQKAESISWAVFRSLPRARMYVRTRSSSSPEVRMPLRKDAVRAADCRRPDAPGFSDCRFLYACWWSLSLAACGRSWLRTVLPQRD